MSEQCINDELKSQLLNEKNDESFSTKFVCKPDDLDKFASYLSKYTTDLKDQKLAISFINANIQVILKRDTALEKNDKSLSKLFKIRITYFYFKNLFSI